MRYIFSIILMLSFFYFADAEDLKDWQVQNRSEGQFMNNSVQTGWAGYLGVMTGYLPHNSDLDVEGTPSSVKLIGSYVSKNSIGVFDLGYGVQTQSFVNNRGGDRQMSNPVIEAAARFQFEDRWQSGVIYDSFFNQGRRFGANQADMHFAGLQLLREFGIGNRFVGRIGARVMTSMNVDYNQVNMGAIDFQLGWGQVFSWTSEN